VSLKDKCFDHQYALKIRKDEDFTNTNEAKAMKKIFNKLY
jgi:hypothetical protein